MEIIEILKKNGVSVKELSKNTGIPEPRIYKWYANKVSPKYADVAILEKYIADVLKIPNKLNAEDINTDYLTSRRKLKQGKNDNDGIVYVPISAQAGYSKRYKEPIYLNTLETAYLPGTRYRGEKYRIFEVDGDSMIPTLKDGQKVIAAFVDKDDWQSSPNYYMYVLVSEDMISIKRIFRKSSNEWVLISDNEDFYEQFSFDVTHLKELWIVKEKFDWDLAPPKKFEIKI